MLIASLQVLYQCRLLWPVGDGGMPWARVGLVLGSACLAKLAECLLGLGRGRRPLSLVVGAVLGSAMVPLGSALCVALGCGFMRLWWGVWEVGRCLF